MSSVKDFTDTKMPMTHKTAVFAGSFDPFTMGHFDILSRACLCFDKIYVAVAADTGGKVCKLSIEGRTQIVKESVKELKNVIVESFEGFLADFAVQKGASFIVRGLRTANDFEYEKSLMEVYKSQVPKLELIYLISSHNYCHISSTIVRELAAMGGNMNGYVHPSVEGKVSNLYGAQERKWNMKI